MTPPTTDGPSGVRAVAARRPARERGGLASDRREGGQRRGTRLGKISAGGAATAAGSKAGSGCRLGDGDRLGDGGLAAAAAWVCVGLDHAFTDATGAGKGSTYSVLRQARTRTRRQELEHEQGAEETDEGPAEQRAQGRPRQTGGRPDSIATLEPLVRERERSLGPDHPRTLGTRSALADAYAAAGRIQDAIAILEPLRTTSSGSPAPSIPTRSSPAATSPAPTRPRAAARTRSRSSSRSSAIASGSSAPITRTRSRRAATSPTPTTRRGGSGRDRHVRALLADFERLLGSDHPSTLRARNDLSNAYRVAGREDAAAILEPLLADRERVLGADHPDTLEQRGNLAGAHQAAGRLDEAIAIFEPLLADREEILGAEHPDTLGTRASLATVLHAAGKVQDTLRIYEPLVEDLERILGAEHADTLTVRSGLATAYQDAGRPADAIAVFEPLVADLERVHGNEHATTLGTRNNLASTYQDAGRIDEAIALYEPLVADLDRVLGADHPTRSAPRQPREHLRGRGRGADASARGFRPSTTRHVHRLTAGVSWRVIVRLVVALRGVDAGVEGGDTAPCRRRRASPDARAATGTARSPGMARCRARRRSRRGRRRRRRRDDETAAVDASRRRRRRRPDGGALLGSSIWTM